MRIPTDIPLAVWIRKLIKANKEYLFYQTTDWKELRQSVLESFHYECQECLKKGIYTRAHCVHHVNELKSRPDLSMSRVYTDHEGKTQIQLLPLCDACHNKIHKKLEGYQKRDKFQNIERW